MRACLIPLRVEVRNPQVNLQHLQQRLNEVSRYQPDIVCLPECAFTGYLCDEADLKRFAEPIYGPTTQQVSLMAKQYHCYICFGMIERACEGIYNSAILIDRAGQIVLVHRKIVEKPPFLNGNSVKTVETELGRLVILICGELFHEEVRAMIDMPVNALLLPMARCFDGKSPDLDRWMREERQAYLDEVKKVGVTTFIVNALENLPYGASFGGAMVVDATGKLLAESPHGTDEALIFDLNQPAVAE